MVKRLFITATDTNAGKTVVSAGLLRTAASRKLRATGIKPIASGCTRRDGKLCNDDVDALQQASSFPLATDVMNPFRFEPAIAPHLAAAQCGVKLNVSSLVQRTQSALSTSVDVQIIEGFGGWLAPLNDRETMADYASAVNSEVIMIVGIRLGCLNHAALTERAIIASGVSYLGWIANLIDPAMPYQRENIETLQQCLRSPLLGIVGYGELAEHALRDHTIF